MGVRTEFRIRNAAFLLALLVALLIVGGCGGKTGDDPKINNPIDKVEQIVNPQIKIITPANGETLMSTNVKIEVNVVNFQLVDMLGKGNTLHAGHIHYIIDGGPPIPTTVVNMPVTLTEGKHTIKVELHNNDHSPLSPPVEALSTFIISP